jgi:hypothetical protein
MVCPFGQNVVGPAGQSVMSQLCEPTWPAGQSRTHRAPVPQTTLHGPLVHAKWQTLSAPHMQVPLAHVPSQRGLDPSHSTLHGGTPHENAQFAPCAHVHTPLSHAPVQVEPAAHRVWHGGLEQVKSQWAPAPQSHSPLPHPPWHSGLFPTQFTLHGGVAQG